MIYAKDNQLDIKQLGKVRHRDSVEVQLAKLEAAWEARKHLPNYNHALGKSVFAAFRADFCYAVFWNFIVTMLQLTTPFLLYYIIKIIQNQNPDETWQGIGLLSALMFAQGISYFIKEHMTLY